MLGIRIYASVMACFCFLFKHLELCVSSSWPSLTPWQSTCYFSNKTPRKKSAARIGLNFLSVGLLVWSAMSCSYDQMDPPEVILNDSLLVNILADGYILNAAFNQTAGMVKDSISKSYKKQVLDKYQISQDVLDQNVEWRYAEGRMDSIFNLMMERMNYLEDNISSKSDNQKKINATK